MGMVSLLVWSTVFAVVTTIVANAKGLSLGKWAAIGFILGPIGVIWSLVAARNEVTLAERQVDAGQMKKCPFCAEHIKTEAVVCKHCGKEQPPIDPMLLEKWVCTHCKAICKGSQSTCWVCNKPRSTT
jgi:RNA polymerase subunit RPABC4/transcription elongation factor Spt4